MRFSSENNLCYLWFITHIPNLIQYHTLNYLPYDVITAVILVKNCALWTQSQCRVYYHNIYYAKA